MTIQQMAQQALDVQTACNLSGIVHSFAEIVSAMRTEHHMDTAQCNRHPVCVLFSDKIADMTGSSVRAYPEGYAECQRLADGSITEPSAYAKSAGWA